MQEKITHKKYLQEKYRKRVNMADKASKTKKASKFKGFNNILAVRLRQLMYGSGTTQQELAEKTGCSRQAIAQYMDGSNAPNIDKLILIAEFFNVSIDYLVGKDKEQTEEELVQSIVNYTGLKADTIENLKKGKNAVFNTTLLNFLINNRKLLKALNNYLLSSIYSDYRKSEYMYLPLKDKAVYIRNPDIAQKVAYSNLLEVLPLQKEKMTEQIKDNEELKEKLLFALAKKSVDIQECKKEEIKIYGIECYLEEEYYNSEQFEQDQLQACYDEYEENQRAEEEFEEEMHKRNDFILWFMSELSKQKDGENNGNNT